MKVLIYLSFLLFSVASFGQSVGIGTANPTPGYLLDVNGNLITKGLRLKGPGNYFLMEDGNNSNKLFRWTATGGYLRNAYNTVSPFSLKNLVVIDSTGKVGVGEVNPTTWLEVTNNSYGQLARFNGGDDMWVTFAENGINRGYIGSYSGNSEDVELGTYGGNSTGKVHLTTGNTPRLSVDAMGNIGIGTLPTASHRLEVTGGNVRFRNDSSPLNFVLRSNTQRNITFKNNIDETDAIIKSYGKNLYFGRGHVFTDLTIDEDGDVGIGGEIVPVSKLQVVGGNEVSLTEHGMFMLGTTSSANLIFDENEILSRNNGVGTDLFMQHNGGNLILCGNELGAVGIGIGNGTSLPAGSLLAVDGKITCEEVLVKMSQNWPDYVFSDDYKLPKLSEVKKFIEANNHLPGIPKAADIEKDGLELGALQTKMMEKIEELTLYVIKLHEEIEQLKSNKK